MGIRARVTTSNHEQGSLGHHKSSRAITSHHESIRRGAEIRQRRGRSGEARYGSRTPPPAGAAPDCCSTKSSSSPSTSWTHRRCMATQMPAERARTPTRPFFSETLIPTSPMRNFVKWPPERPKIIMATQKTPICARLPRRPPLAHGYPEGRAWLPRSTSTGSDPSRPSPRHVESARASHFGDKHDVVELLYASKRATLPHMCFRLSAMRARAGCLKVGLPPPPRCPTHTSTKGRRPLPLTGRPTGRY